jgi:hypothetical protein
MKSTVFWDVMPCRSSDILKEHTACTLSIEAYYLLFACMLGILSDCEDGYGTSL